MGECSNVEFNLKFVGFQIDRETWRNSSSLKYTNMDCIKTLNFIKFCSVSAQTYKKNATFLLLYHHFQQSTPSWIGYHGK